MKKKINMHIGFGKTGTTSIQFFCKKNSSRLLEHGHFYPESGQLQGGHHLLAPLGEKLISDEVRILYKQLIEEVQECKANEIVLSSENFCFSNDSFVNFVWGELKNFDVRIIFYVRPQPSLIESTFLERQKTGKSKSDSIYSFYCEHKKSFDFNLRISPWEECFGREAVTCRVYDRHIIGDDVISDFLSLIGLPDFSGLPVGIQNTSLRPEFSNLVSLVDSTNIESGDRRKILKELMWISEAFKSAEKTPLVGEELRKEIQRSYRESNLMFASNYLDEQNAEALCHLNDED